MKAAKVPARRPAPAERPKVTAPEELDADVQPVGSQAWFITLLVAGVVVLGASTFIAFGHTMPGWEHHIFTAINGVSWPHWVAAQVAKPLSDAVYGMIALVGVLLLVPRYRQRAWQYAVAGGGTFVFTAIIEQIVNRARPAGLTHDLILRADQGGAGFPSGHVATLTALCLTVWLFVSWPWRIVLLVLVAAEAWARIFLGVHAPLDVVGGVAAAAVVVAVLHLAPVKLRKFFKLD
jgi:membrane-associated phospholipid phosphatase